MTKSLPRDVLTALLGVADPDAASTAPPSRDYPLTRRVLAGLLGVQLPEHRPRRPAGRPRPPAAPGRPRFSRLLLFLAGADPEILAMVPTERIKFQSLGWAILITSGTTTVTMWFALTSALGVSGFVAALLALAWGLGILTLDRLLTNSMLLGNRWRKLITAAPRLMLALLMGVVISTPLVLRIFQPEINAQLAVIKEQQYNAGLTSLQHSALGQQVSHWQAEVNSLQTTINARGQVQLNPAADPVVQSLTRQRGTAIAQEQTYYREWNCQLYGGPGCPTTVGNGSAAQQAHQSYEAAAFDVTQINSEINARAQALTSTSAASAKARLQQAKSTLPSAQQHLATTQKQLDVLRESLTATINGGTGLLERLSALDQLTRHDPAVEIARLLLLLLILVIDLLPVTVKLLQVPGNYEKLLVRQEELLVKVVLIQRQRMTGQDKQPPVPSPSDTTPLRPESHAGPPLEPDSVVPDDLRREIEAIYPFMDETGEGGPPKYRAELENYFLAISKGANDLLRRGYDTEQIIEALQFLTDTVTRQLAEARQAVLEQSADRGQE